MMTRPTKVLFLTANPSDTAALQLDEEIRLIGQRIRRGEYRKLFEIRSAPALRATDLPYELMDNTPDVVHFSGHGSAAGELFFVRDGDGTAMPIPAKTLARVFKQFRDRVRCVVLNACFSAIQAEAIAESIPCVVGMSRQVLDATAIAFAAGFYEALAFNKSVAEAFELGLTQVDLADPGGAGSAEIPKLIVRPGEDASKVHLITIAEAESKPGNPWAAVSAPVTATRTQRIGKIQTSGDANAIRIGQYGRTGAAESESQEVEDLAVGGNGNQVVVEQKKT